MFHKKRRIACILYLVLLFAVIVLAFIVSRLFNTTRGLLGCAAFFLLCALEGRPLCLYHTLYTAAAPSELESNPPIYVTRVNVVSAIDPHHNIELSATRPQTRSSCVYFVLFDLAA